MSKHSVDVCRKERGREEREEEGRGEGKEEMREQEKQKGGEEWTRDR